MENHNENDLSNANDISNNNGNDANNTSNKAKRKRRSKNEQEGRSFRCDTCGKSYLSQPALTNHNKTKHFQNDPSFKRGRGRPRKNPLLPLEKDSIRFKHFFEKETRKRREGPEGEFNPIDSVRDVFSSMYLHYREKIFIKNPDMEAHNLFKTVTDMIQNSSKNSTHGEVEKDLSNMSQYKIIDEIFSKYLEDVYRDCNKEYFEFITKFVILFRECINKHKDDSTGEEYSTKSNADNVPDMCNEFITDFMEGYDYFGLDTMELIDIIQHLCNWLYENKFTTSKLSLVS